MLISVTLPTAAPLRYFVRCVNSVMYRASRLLCAVTWVAAALSARLLPVGWVWKPLILVCLPLQCIQFVNWQAVMMRGIPAVCCTTFSADHCRKSFEFLNK